MVTLPRVQTESVHKGASIIDMSWSTTGTRPPPPPLRYQESFQHIVRPQQNPHLSLVYDIVRNTKTLHFQINISKPPSSNREFLKSMKGYCGIMSASACSHCDLHGNGEKVHLENKHCLWQPKNTGETKEEPVWHLRVSVLKDQEARGDCLSRRFVSLVPAA